MRWPWAKNVEAKSLNSILRQIAMAYETVSGISVTPETCMRSPTVHAIVTAVSRRIAVSPVKVYQKTTSNGRTSKEELPDHPVAKLLQKPNKWQTKSDYWADATSSLLRHGRYHAFIGRGETGPIRELVPLCAGEVEIKQDENYNVFFKHENRDIPWSRMHYARLAARNYYKGDSPIEDIRESVAMEIAAEQFGASFFGNGGMPLLYFKLMEGVRDFKTDDDKREFLESFKESFGGKKKFSTFMLPKGLELGDISVENDKAQFIESRKYFRTVICGAYGVPVHFAGDLERATMNNVEQQDSDFVLNVVLPVAQTFEASMERDLLTDSDRRGGVIIRFNLDAVHRADLQTRQNSFKIMRDNGVLSANEWREHEGMNPISDEDGGDDYLISNNVQVAGQPMNPTPPPTEPMPKP